MKKERVKGIFCQDKRADQIWLPRITIIDMKIVKVPNELMAQKFSGLINIRGKKNRERVKIINPVNRIKSPS